MTITAILAVSSAAATHHQNVEASSTDAAVPGITMCDLPKAKGDTARECSSQLFGLLADQQPHAPVQGGGAAPPSNPADVAPAEMPTSSDGAAPAASGWTGGVDASGPSRNPSASQAKAGFTEAFGGLIAQLDTPTIPEDSDVVAFSGDSAVVVDPDKGANQLIDSALPLNTPGASEAPIDVSLEREDGEYAPANALVETTLPAVSSEPARLDEADIGIRLAGQPDDGAPARRIGDIGLFYHEVATDTDMFIAPKSTGVELFAQLRSPASPQSLEFDLAIPEGGTAELSQEAEGTVVIANEQQEPIAEIAAPVAVDATGRPVAVETDLKDDVLTLKVEHDADDAYPLLVDPEVVDVYNWPAGSSFTGWAPFQSDSDYGLWAFSSYFTPGLYNQAPAGRTYSAGSLSGWFYDVPHINASGAPATAYVADAVFKNVAFDAPSTFPYSPPRMVLGMWSRRYSRWVRKLDYITGFATTNLSLATWAALQAGTSQTEAQRLDFQLYVPAGGPNAVPPTTRTGRIHDVEVHLSDPEPPTSISSGLGGWYDGQEPIPVHVNTSDPGLGVKTETLVPGFDEDGNFMAGVGTSTATCDGTPRNPCPRTTSRDYSIDPVNLAEGVQLALPVAWDAVGQGSIAANWYAVDRTPPVVTDISGSMLSTTGGTKLKVEATDGEPFDRDAQDSLALASAGSGVRQIEVQLDGAVVSNSHVVQQPCEGDGITNNGAPSTEIPWGSCSMARTFEFNATSLAGTHVVDVIVTDQVGNVSSQSASVTIGPEPATSGGEPTTSQVIDLSYQDPTDEINIPLTDDQSLVQNPDGSVDIVEPDPDIQNMPLEAFDEQILSSTEGDAPQPPPWQGRPATAAELDAIEESMLDALDPNLSATERARAETEIQAALDAYAVGASPYSVDSATTHEAVVATIPDVATGSNGQPVPIDLSISGGDTVVAETPFVGNNAPGTDGTGRRPAQARVTVFPRNRLVRQGASPPPNATFFRKATVTATRSVTPTQPIPLVSICHRTNNQNTVESGVFNTDLVKVGLTIYWCQTGTLYPSRSVKIRDTDRKAQVLPGGASSGWSFVNWLNTHEGWNNKNGNPHYAYYKRVRALFNGPGCTIGGLCQTSTPSVYIRVAADGDVRREDRGG